MRQFCKSLHQQFLLFALFKPRRINNFVIFLVRSRSRRQFRQLNRIADNRRSFCTEPANSLLILGKQNLHNVRLRCCFSVQTFFDKAPASEKDRRFAVNHNHARNRQAMPVRKVRQIGNSRRHKNVRLFLPQPFIHKHGPFVCTGKFCRSRNNPAHHKQKFIKRPQHKIKRRITADRKITNPHFVAQGIKRNPHRIIPGHQRHFMPAGSHFIGKTTQNLFGTARCSD